VTWRNWAGNQASAPFSVERPSSEEHLVEIVRRAVAAGRRVKAVGAGHSFTGIACTDGTLVDLRDYGAVVDHDSAARTVTVQSGITLAALSDELARRGLALENMGDINRQSIAGAISTSTHGTGTRFGGLATHVARLRLVTAAGEVLDCSPTVNADVFDMARVGLGALGLLSTLTLRCSPAFNLHAVEEAMPVDDVLADFDGFMDQTDHVEFYWVPHTRWALTKANTRTDEPVRPRPRMREWVDDVALANVAFGTMCRVGRRFPKAIPKLSRLVPSTGRIDYIDRSDRVFTSPRYVRFVEMEYAIPRDAVPEALNAVRGLVDRLGMPISFPIEVRVSAGDDIPLSTATGRATGYIAVHVYRGTPYDAYFTGVEAIMDEHGGRPHWGKLHFLRADQLAERYPRWDEFQSLRRRLDPDGTFANPYLSRVLGDDGVRYRRSMPDDAIEPVAPDTPDTVAPDTPDAPDPVIVRETFAVDYDGDGIIDGFGTRETTVIDYDGDGRPDAISSIERVTVDVDGDGSPDLHRVRETTAIDVDGDGEADILQHVETTSRDTDGDGTYDEVDRVEFEADAGGQSDAEKPRLDTGDEP
jgi:L-gulonolactone oxidase